MATRQEFTQKVKRFKPDATDEEIQNLIDLRISEKGEFDPETEGVFQGGISRGVGAGRDFPEPSLIQKGLRFLAPETARKAEVVPPKGFVEKAKTVGLGALEALDVPSRMARTVRTGQPISDPGATGLFAPEAEAARKRGQGILAAGIEIIGDPAVAKTGIKLGVKLGVKVASPVIKFLLKASKNIFEEIATNISKVPIKSLKKFGFTGRDDSVKAALAMKDSPAKIASDLVDKVDNIGIDLVDESKAVKDAISSANKVDMIPVINALKKPITDAPIGETKKLVNKLGELVDDITRATDAEAFMNAKKALAIRRQLDSETQALFKAGFPSSDKFEKLVGNANNILRGELVKATPKEFKVAMKSMSKKLEAADNIKSKLRGKNIDLQKEKAERLLINLSGTSPLQTRKDMVKNFDTLFGTDFSERVKILGLASDLIDPKTGRLQIFGKGGRFLGTQLGTLFGATRPLAAVVKGVELAEKGVRAARKLAPGGVGFRTGELVTPAVTTGARALRQFGTRMRRTEEDNNAIKRR